MTKQNAVTTEQLQWLLERINASNDPITREQVQAFGRHPGGPILPPECLAVERLPDTFGTRREALPPLLVDVDVPVNDLAVSPGDHNLWVATVINGESVLRCFGQRVGTPEYEKPSNALRHIALRADGDGARYFSPHIIGFSYGAPVVRLQMHQTAWADDALIYIGQGQKFADQLPTTRIAAMHVAPDGTVLTAHMVGKKLAQIYRNGEIVRGLDGVDIGGLWQCGDDVAWTDALHNGLSAYNFRKPEPGYPLRRLVFDHGVRDVFMRDGALHYATTGSDGHSACIYRTKRGDDGGTDTDNIQFFHGHAYLRGYTDLPDGRIAYIGETARDGRECMVVDGIAGPGFDRVTGLLVRQGQPRYWGALGRHLYTMDLPLRAAAA